MSMRTSKSATRDALGSALSRLAKEDEKIIAFDCDLGRSTRSFSISEADPDRFIEMGIAEQDMISTAAGLASTGKTVFVNTFAVFLTGRAYDQIRQQVALPRTGVIICGSSAGLTQGPDGATHQSVTDINLMRGLPNMEVFAPADAEQAEQIIEYASKSGKPCYIRLSRYATPQVVPGDIPFEPGKIQTLREGSRVALISTGQMTEKAMEAAEMLKGKNINAAVFNCHTIKPIDKTLIEKIADEYDKVFTVEEHSVIGGLGSAVAEVLAEKSGSSKAAFLRIGVPDCFGESGTADEILRKFELDGEGIFNTVMNNM